MSSRKPVDHDLYATGRERTERHGELVVDTTFDMDRGKKDFAAGDRFYFLKRDSSLDVINGTLGTILKIEGKHLHVEIDRDESQTKARSV